MTPWDGTKTTEDGDGVVDADEQLTAGEWNQHVTDGHFPSDELNFGTDANGNPVVTDPTNNDQVVLRYDPGAGQWEIVNVNLELNDNDINNIGSVQTDLNNNTHRAQPSDDLESVVTNDLSTGDTLIVDTEPGTKVHAVDSTLTFSVACTIEFRGYVKPTGDFSAIELQDNTGTYQLYPKGNYRVAADDDGVTTAGTAGVVIKSGYSMAARGRVSDFGGHGVHMLQDGSQSLNHSQPNWLIGNCGGDGFRSENTSGNVKNLNAYRGRVHCFNCDGDGVNIVNGSRHRMVIIGANGTVDSAALTEGADTSKNLYWLEEEGWGNNSDVSDTSRLWIMSSDNSDSGGWLFGNPKDSRIFVNSDITATPQKYKYYVVDTTSNSKDITLPTGVPLGTEIVVLDIESNAGNDFITFSTQSGATYNGSAITTDDGFRRVVQAGSDDWKVVGGNAI
jgi:hypothetical protein